MLLVAQGITYTSLGVACSPKSNSVSLARFDLDDGAISV